LGKFVVHGNEETIHVFRSFGLRNYTAVDEITQMGTSLRENVGIFRNDRSCRKALPPSVEEEI
jgi:hypothetical protein